MLKANNHNDIKDSDNDGLSDTAEEFFGTDPNNPDTDGDGMSDGDEVTAGRNPLGKGKLRDLFIPHEGNNYHPHSLHPKRVLFHAASVVAIKAVVVMFMLGMPVTAWLTPDVLREQQQKVIHLTNAVRQNLGITALAENAALNQAADEKAQDMLVGQYFAHISPDKESLSGFLADAGYSYAVAGENLAMGFADAESVVNAWVASPTHYANLIDADYRDMGVGMISGAFNGYDTTLVAQYFGAPFQAPVSGPALEPAMSVPVPTAPESTSPPNVTMEAGTPADRVLPDNADSIVQLQSDGNTLGAREEAEAIPFAIDAGASTVYVAATDSDGGTPVRVEAAITGAIEAEVLFGSHRIALSPDPSNLALWTGGTIIFETDATQIFNPVVLPALTARDASGATIAADIAWDHIVPVKPSLTSQYFFMKQQDSGVVHSLFAVSSLYFKVLLGLVIMSLLLMIFIEIRKQRPRHIASGFGLIALLVLMIAF